MPSVPRQARIDLAAAVRAAAPDAGGFPGRNRGWPAAAWTSVLRAAGWPTATVVIPVPQREHRGRNAGQRTGDADQPATVVPLSWLRELSRRLGVPLADVCRGKIGDE